MKKLRVLAASTAAALALLVPGATAAHAVTPALGASCTYYTDFDFVGGQLNAYDSKSCGGPSVPAYVVIEKVGAGGTVIPVAYGLGIIHYTCQGSTPTTYKLAGDIDPVVTITPGVVPCG